MATFMSFVALAIFIYMIYCICKWVKNFKNYDTRRSYVHRFWWAFLALFIAVGVAGNSEPESKSEIHHDKVVKIRHEQEAKAHRKHEAKVKAYEATPQYRFTKKLPKSVKKALMNDTDGNSGDKPFVEGQFDAKPYNMNVFIKVPADNYTGNSTATSEIVDAIDATKKYNLSGFQTVKFTIETKLQNDMGNSVGYIPVLWYSFKVSDLKKMNADNMSNSDLATVSVEHGSKKVSTGY